jgi:hypothetical protein
VRPNGQEDTRTVSLRLQVNAYGVWRLGKPANPRLITVDQPINLQAAGEEELLPLGPPWIGPLTDVQLHSQVELPVGYRPQLPAPIRKGRHRWAEHSARNQ